MCYLYRLPKIKQINKLKIPQTPLYSVDHVRQLHLLFGPHAQRLQLEVDGLPGHVDFCVGDPRSQGDLAEKLDNVFQSAVVRRRGVYYRVSERLAVADAAVRLEPIEHFVFVRVFQRRLEREQN